MTDSNKKIFYKNQADSIIKKLALRKMEGYYADSMEEACEKVLELIGSGKKSVAYGGSMTIDNSDLKDRINSAGHGYSSISEIPSSSFRFNIGFRLRDSLCQAICRGSTPDVPPWK